MVTSKRQVMKRVVEARVPGYNAYVRIEITVAADSLELQKTEQRVALDSIADNAMIGLASTPYLKVPLNRVKVH